MQNAFVESFSGRFREECLSDTLFSTLAEARSAINSWKEDHNHYRPHSALGNMTPAEPALKSTLERLPKARNESQDSPSNRRRLGSQVTPSSSSTRLHTFLPRSIPRTNIDIGPFLSRFKTEQS